MNSPHQTIVFQVNDMHCSSCPKLIQMTLAESSGVHAVTASLETKTVVVNYDPKIITIDQIVSVIKDSGYTASPLA